MMSFFGNQGASRGQSQSRGRSRNRGRSCNGGQRGFASSRSWSARNLSLNDDRSMSPPAYSDSYQNVSQVTPFSSNQGQNQGPFQNQGRSHRQGRGWNRGRRGLIGSHSLSMSNISLNDRGSPVTHNSSGRSDAQDNSNQWRCVSCRYDNFLSRPMCRKCNEPRSFTNGGRGDSDNTGRGGNGGGGPNVNNRGMNRNNNDDQVKKVVKLLKKSNSVCRTIEQSSDIYLKAWQECRKLTISEVETLIVTMAKLPSSFQFEIPPPVVHCKTAVVIYVEFHEKKKSEEDFAETVVDKITNVINFTQRLLEIEWPNDLEEVRSELTELLNKLNGLIIRSHKRHRQLSGEIDKILEDMEKDWTFIIKHNKKTSKKSLKKSELASKISLWENATIEWLSDPKRFQPVHLPKMKVPEDNNSMGVYTNKKDYFDTISRLWVGLTFCDGNAALNPKCRYKTMQKECGMVLWSVEGTGEQYKESCRKCKGKPVVLACQNYTHKSALCKRCCNQLKKAMIGPGGQCASTHIYDFVVKKVDFEGRIYMHLMNCRRPPQQPIHWRSTSRLKVSCLVAVVKIPERNAALKMSDNIIWTEVALHREAKDEFRRRENGEMVVADLRDTKSQLQRGDNVAVIDCMTFVPEHIPVLRALDELQLSSLPFEEGALLNISNGNKRLLIDYDAEFREISTRRKRYSSESDSSFQSNSEDESEELDKDSNDGFYDMPSSSALIDFLISKSKLSPLIQIRGDEQQTEKLKDELCKLVESTTLDREQLKSFVEALVEPVHLTQGPPGTGKSYLGVVIVRALLMIRSAWLSVSQSVQGMPILVLSYKNHAIDEFLVDLVTSENSVSMIRIGGSCNEPILHQYLERNQSTYQMETRKHRDTLNKLHEQKIKYQETKSNLSPLMQYAAVKDDIMLDEETNKEKKQASYLATQYLCNIIAQIQIVEDFLEGKGSKNSLLGSEYVSTASDEDDDSDDDEDKIVAVWDKLFNKRVPTNVKSDDIQALSDMVKHYNLRTQEIILRWIIGENPKPKCYHSECTNTVIDLTYVYCDKHLCVAEDNDNKRCVHPRLPDVLLCKYHSCQFKECLAVKLPDPQVYCDEHACFVCVREKLIAKQAEDEPPRNTCGEHLLCTALVDEGTSCPELAVNATTYCKQHAWPTCSFISKNEKCSEPVIAHGTPFCEMHKPKPKPKADILITGTRCKATTRKGKPCKGKPLTGFQYCKDHLKDHRDVEEDTQSWVETTENIGGTEKVEEFRNVQLEKPMQKPTVEEAEKNAEKDKLDKEDNFYDALDGEEPLPDDETIKPSDEEDFSDDGDQYEHIRDVYVIEDREEEENSEDEAQAEVAETVDESDLSNQLIPVSEWTWDLKQEQRWNQVQLLENKYKMLLSKLNEKHSNAIEIAREEYHKSKVRAKSKVYESKAVIGGTIVGCIGRLESIRKIKPFAILVEEASEVLEPLLFSCLGEETVKFEMIGDHLQLKPSIMSKIMFERKNRINVSLFERLINAPPANRVPSSCLSIQRRMRKNICDLTREFYDEIVDIEDHALCSKQKVGDKLLYSRGRRNNSLIYVKKCTGSGREVPGILPHLFFWTHTGIQTKAVVGLSRVNHNEADMALHITQYLVACGVPKPSIAILTPYKGQLMLMRKQMISSKLLDKFSQDNSVRMSTVDRFQGDEADIVIISLVIDAKSRTPFVKLCNRMVVLLSRARLGMYILGNIGYFEEEKNDSSIGHWLKTIEKLRHPSESDTNPTSVKEDINDLHYKGPRLGNELPICCPIHREKSIRAKSAAELQLNFCDIICTEILSCSHPCNLNCHFQNLDNHNKKCGHKIKPPPCPIHNIDLTCSDVYSNIGFHRVRNLNIDEALSRYQCPDLVKVQLPCQHEVQMTCASETDIANGKTNYPECKELAHNPYFYSGCCHELVVLCCVWFEYKKNPTLVPPCKEKVNYTPSCGHTVLVQCYLKQKYDNKTETFQCQQKVDISLPRCGHEAKVTCDKALQLQHWTGESCTTEVIREGQSYGPIDYVCDKMVDFQRKCGHKSQMKCKDAFEQAKQKALCYEKVDVMHPACGHQVSLQCYQKQSLEVKGVLKPRQAIKVVEEGKTKLTFGSQVLPVKCDSMVTLLRNCGHQPSMKCCDVQNDDIQLCNESVTVCNKLCMHETTMPCSMAPIMSAWNPWANGQSSLLDGVLNAAHKPPVMPPPELEKFIFKCKEKIEVQRSDCMHKFEAQCSVAMRQFTKQALMRNRCTENIKDAPLRCKHRQDFVCWEYQEYVQNPTKIICKKEVVFSCWNFDICKNVIKSKCNFTGSVFSCKEKSNWKCERKHVIKDVNLCQDGFPSHCPECILEDIHSLIKSLKGSTIAEKNGLLLPALLEPFKPENVCNDQKLKSFSDSQLTVLNNLKTWFKKQSSFTRPLLNPCIRPCFRYSFEEIFSLDFKEYMKSATLNGTQVWEWTLNNIEKLIVDARKRKKLSVCLLFGFVYCCRVLVDPDDFPGKKRKHYEKASWISKKRKEGYSIVQHNRNESWDHFIVWDPYPIIATHTVWLSVNNLLTIASQMKEQPIMRSELKTKFISFQIPAEAESFIVPEDYMVEDEEEDPSNFFEEDSSETPMTWDGISLGRFEEHVQKELFNKLQFCMSASGSSASKKPFDGLNYLVNLKKSLTEDLPDILLLEAMEQQKLEDFNAANEALNQYCQKVSNNDLHPLHIIATARRFLYEDETSQNGKNLLHRFADLYPYTVEKWFTAKEILLLDDEEDEESGEPGDLDNPLTKWETFKDNENIESEQMDELMKLTGLRKVKTSALNIYKAAWKFSQLSPEVQAANPKSLNFCFLGNAGSGKTTVARMLAGILKDSGARPKGTFLETSAQKLKDEGPEKFRTLADEAEDGVLFIDEAYDLDPKGDFKGKPIVSELLVIAENKRDRLSIILAGYEDDMNEKLFSFNEGIKSRFEIVHFEDFNEKELKTIWEGELKKRHFTSDERAGIVVSKRLFKSAGRKGFGNARAVRKEVEKAIAICMNREGFDEKHMVIEIKDVMGEDPLNNPKLQEVLDEFEEKIGWSSIKKSVAELLEICKKNYEKQLLGQKTLPIMLNRLFVGNPGTGKTTCAHLYGRLLKELSILSVGDVVMASTSDFVGSVVGESQRKTNEMLEKARGKVLVIDEAYNLDDKMYGKQVLDTIVEKVQNTESDDIAVLLLGYEKQMREMLRNQNPGLARRFSADYPFVFEDYNQEELWKILQFSCKKENIQLSSEVAEKIINELEKQKTQTNFGNAGAINNLIRVALAKAAARPLLTNGWVKLLPSDIDSDESESADSNSDPLAPLDKLYRMEKIREELIKIRNTFQVAKAEGARDMPELGHFVFRGAPGTGKTTVARAMAKILFDLGLLARNHVEETSGLDLTGEYVGQTKKKVQEKLDAAKGGVLFIDEAYELGKGVYGEEAMTTILAAMTDPEYKLVIIIAGYPGDMEKMLMRNVGLKSRFTRYMDFLDWNNDDCVKFLEKKAASDNFVLEENAKAIIADGTTELRSYPGWGNARDAIAMWKVIMEERASRVISAPETCKTITTTDVAQAVTKMVSERKPKADPKEMVEKLQLEREMEKQLKQFEIDDANESVKMEEKTVMKERQTEDEKVEEKKPDENEGRDPGVPDAVWEELQRAKNEEENRKKEIELEKRKLKEHEELVKKLRTDLENKRKKLLEEEERKATEEAARLLQLKEQLQKEREQEKKRQLQLQLDEQRKKEEEIRKKLLAERERQKKEAERLRRLELERKRLLDAARKRAEEEQKKQAMQEKLRQISNCPAGFTWHKVGGGWRCAGGSHFVSDRQLKDQFTY